MVASSANDRATLTLGFSERVNTFDKCCQWEVDSSLGMVPRSLEETLFCRHHVAMYSTLTASNNRTMVEILRYRGISHGNSMNRLAGLRIEKMQCIVVSLLKPPFQGVLVG